MAKQKSVCTLGMFIIDQFEFRDSEGNLTGKVLPEAVSSLDGGRSPSH